MFAKPSDSQKFSGGQLFQIIKASRIFFSLRWCAVVVKAQVPCHSVASSRFVFLLVTWVVAGMTKVLIYYFLPIGQV